MGRHHVLVGEVVVVLHDAVWLDPLSPVQKPVIFLRGEAIVGQIAVHLGADVVNLAEVQREEPLLVVKARPLLGRWALCVEVFGGLALDEKRSALLTCPEDGPFRQEVRSDEVPEGK